MTEIASLADIPFCYLTTRGRATGRPHTIEIWFALEDRTVYLLSGGGRRSDWVRNLEATPEVHLRLGDIETEALARIVDDPAEDALARKLVHDKYARGAELERWRDSALPVAIDISDRR